MTRPLPPSRNVIVCGIGPPRALRRPQSALFDWRARQYSPVRTSPTECSCVVLAALTNVDENGVYLIRTQMKYGLLFPVLGRGQQWEYVSKRGAAGIAATARAVAKFQIPVVFPVSRELEAAAWRPPPQMNFSLSTSSQCRRPQEGG